VIDLANAGVAIRRINPLIPPINQDLLPFNILHSPFLLGPVFITAFHMPTQNLRIKLIYLFEFIAFLRMRGREIMNLNVYF
jgi:hypothetical protein